MGVQVDVNRVQVDGKHEDVAAGSVESGGMRVEVNVNPIQVDASTRRWPRAASRRECISSSLPRTTSSGSRHGSTWTRATGTRRSSGFEGGLIAENEVITTPLCRHISASSTLTLAPPVSYHAFKCLLKSRIANGVDTMTDARSNPVTKPTKARSRWTSFIGTFARGREVRGLQEEGNPKHRVRVEHSKHTLLVHISDEDGRGWTTLAIDRATREWSIAQRGRQLDAAEAAYEQLYV